MLRVDQLKNWKKKKFELSYFKLIFVLEQIYFFNISSLSATSRRCLQHLVVCNISLSATSRCLQHLVVCNISLSATSHCLQHLVVCNTSLFATPRCLQHLVVCKTSLFARPRCLHHLVVCNTSLLQSINISSFYSIHILISRCERLIRSDHQISAINQRQLVLLYSHTNFTMRATDQIRSSDQCNQSTSARFILFTILMSIHLSTVWVRSHSIKCSEHTSKLSEWKRYDFSKTSRDERFTIRSDLEFKNSRIQWRDQHVIALHAFINE
jgi:hypothetical protein